MSSGSCDKPITMSHAEISMKGRNVSVPSLRIDGRTIITTGTWLKTAAVQDEDCIEGDTFANPETLASQLKGTRLNADILTFAQRLPDITPKYPFYLERDSMAVIPITSHSDWWERLAKYDVRAAVKKAAKRGIVTRRVEFSDSFAEGIVAIYNESAFRQGKPFWHYKKDFETVKQMSSTYLERSIFIGAYFQNELVGFIKMLRVGKVAYTFHVISMKKHFDKKPTNALIAKAVEICAENRMSHLVYGNFVYKDPKSLLTEFKRRNGFQEVLVPRYYVALTLKGKIALRLKLHKGVAEMLPQNVWRALLRLRTMIWRSRRIESERGAAEA